MSGPVFLLCDARPPAYKAEGKHHEAFRRRLAAVHKAHGSPKLEGLLYGVVYWFVFGYNPHQHPDADNISKPVWDSLGDLGAYGDDKQIRLRLAGIYDVGLTRSGTTALEGLNPSSLPLSVLSEFQAFLNQDAMRPARRSLTYIEFGSLRGDMLAFNVAKIGISR